MPHFVHCLGCILFLSVVGGAAAADDQPDPPHKHYSVSRIPPDPALATAPKVGHYRGWIPSQVDLTKLMPPVGDQGELGSGIAWAVAYAARSYYVGRNEGRDIARADNEASPSYVFSMAIKRDCDDGANLTDAVDVLRKGALSLAAYPYKPRCEGPPAAADVERAKDFRVRGYRVLENSRIDDMKGQLEHSNPIITLFRISPAFIEFRGSSTFQEDERKSAPSADADMYQPLVIVGYDDNREAVRVMNSWGRGWGDKGFAWIAYKDLPTRSKGSIVLDVGAP